MIQKSVSTNKRNNNFFIGRINSIEYFDYKKDNLKTRAARFVVMENITNPQSISFVIFGNLMRCLLQVRSGDMVQVFYKIYAQELNGNFYNNIVIKSIYKV